MRKSCLTDVPQLENLHNAKLPDGDFSTAEPLKDTIASP